MIKNNINIFFLWNANKKHLLIYLLIVTFFLTLYYNLENGIQPEYNNYFVEEAEQLTIGFLLNIPNCKILNMSAYDIQIQPFLKTDLQMPQCPSKNWSYQNNSYLILNQTAIIESGYSMSSISCCFNVIKRVEQSPNSYTRDADKLFNFSKECFKISSLLTEMVDEFIRVSCTAKYWPYFFNVVYKDYHSFALPHQNAKMMKKIEKWRNKKNGKPPNIFFFGFDSVSRLNSIRNFIKVRRYLEYIGANEMVGYTKVGDNTFPNSVAYHTGYSEEELEETCYKRYEKQDFCPYLWKKFDASSYFTAIIEDVPSLAEFNYMKTGFVEKPVDFYPRSTFLKAHMRTTGYFLDCIGDKTNEEFMLRNLESFMNASSIHNVPYYIYSWFTKLAHEDQNEAQAYDDLILNFLQRIDLSNTILFFMSDHGMRFGEFRNTNPGWFEEKLPMQWVYIPPSMSSKYKDWKKNLIKNSERLTSPYDIFQTLAHVLKTELNVEVEDSVRMNGTVLQRHHGVSLFKEVPLERTCEDAGIPSRYCACSSPTKLPLQDSNLQPAAESAVMKINSILPSQCANLTLDRIHSGASLKTRKNSGELTTYVVGFSTSPGEFIFEANVNLVNLDENRMMFMTESLPSRNSKINRDTSCIHDNRVELFCYCLS